VDQQLVRRLREEVGDVLAGQRRDDAVNGIMPMSGEDERQFARAVIGRVLESFARNEIAAGRTPPTVLEDEGLSEGVHAALFGVGRLQPLLDDPMVENIDINGADRVFVATPTVARNLSARWPTATRSWSSWCRSSAPTRA